MSSRLVIILGIVLITASCGFRPLYAPASGKSNNPDDFTFETLKKVNISRIRDREGQFLRNKLIELMHPNGGADIFDYNFNVSIFESKTSLAVRRSSDATRANLTMTGGYTLVKLDDKSVLLSGSVRSTSGYNIFESEFQTLSAEKSARERALIDVAYQLRLRVSTAFSTGDFKEPDPKKDK